MEIALIVWLLMGILAAIIAQSKGRSAAGFGCAGIILGPIGLLMAAFAGRKDPRRAGDIECPSCAEMIRPNARVCRFCGELIAPREDSPQFRPPLEMPDFDAAAQKRDRPPTQEEKMLGIFAMVVILGAVIAYNMAA